MTLMKEMVLRVICCCLYFMLTGLLWQQGYVAAALLGLILTVAFVVMTVGYVERILSRLGGVAAAINCGDFSQRPQVVCGLPVERELVRTYELVKNAFATQQAENRLLAGLLEQVNTEVLILKENDAGPPMAVYLANRAFLQLFDVPFYKVWDYFAERLGGVFDLINEACRANGKTAIDLEFNHGGRQAYTLSVTTVAAGGGKFHLVLLESIQSVVEKKEKHAYFNLMKVISHELLNTLTPISSYAESMQYILSDGEPDVEDIADIREGLKNISESTDRLVYFIAAYRELAELPAPVLGPVPAPEIFDRAIRLMLPELERAGIALRNEVDNVLVKADEGMMHRVVVNLLSNSIKALQGRRERIITVKAKQQGSRAILTVYDNGSGIKSDLGDKVYLPFFTTRDSGTGIGLALVKSIMEAHGGYVSYESNEEGTTFELNLGVNG